MLQSRGDRRRWAVHPQLPPGRCPSGIVHFFIIFHEKTRKAVKRAENRGKTRKNAQNDEKSTQHYGNCTIPARHLLTDADASTSGTGHENRNSHFLYRFCTVSRPVSPGVCSKSPLSSEYTVLLKFKNPTFPVPIIHAEHTETAGPNPNESSSLDQEPSDALA